MHRVAAKGTPILGRVSALLAHWQQVLSSVALNTLLQWASDPCLACLMLLTVFFWGCALNLDGTILVTCLSQSPPSWSG